MNTKFLKALPLLLGLVSGMTGCIDRTQTSDPTSSAVQEGGKVSFRLSSEDLAKLSVAVDSVRIEAVRDGFPLQVATGSLGQETLLSNLAAGGWTLRVALFDGTQSIQYYGEAFVQIVSGRTVDAVVRLSRATGSVRVRIVVDPDPSTLSDTLVLGYGGQNPSWTPVKAWRTKAGVYLIGTLQVPCEFPVLSYDESYLLRKADPTGPALDMIMPPVDRSRWILGKKVDTGRVCDAMLRERTYFVPWLASGSVTLVTSTGDLVLPDPSGPLPADTVRVTVYPSKGTLPGFLPILAAFRDDSGVRILTQYHCQAPVVRSLPDSGLRWVFGSNPDIAMKCMVGAPAPVWVFVPKSLCGTIQLEDANGKLQYLPGGRCIDPPPPSQDTVTIKAIDGIMLSRIFEAKDGLPVDKVWRDASAIWVYSRFDCNIEPQAYYNIKMSSGVDLVVQDMPMPLLAKLPAPEMIEMTLVRPQMQTEMACPEVPHLVRIPFAPEKAVLFRSLVTGAETWLPGTSGPIVTDSSFNTYTSVGKNLSYTGIDYVLHATGEVERTFSTGSIVVDTTVVVERAKLDPDTFKMVVGILESPLVRRPQLGCVVVEPAILPAPEGLDGGMVIRLAQTRVRSVTYNNGSASTQSLNLNLDCLAPESWRLLDAVDRALEGSFGILR